MLKNRKALCSCRQKFGSHGNQSFEPATSRPQVEHNNREEIVTTPRKDPLVKPTSPNRSSAKTTATNSVLNLVIVKTGAMKGGRIHFVQTIAIQHGLEKITARIAVTSRVIILLATIPKQAYFSFFVVEFITSNF
ncbi:hypothetical protein CSKR_114074 [Clonorchis sinensis]|uniref:Uncharacterized protein n=2 Tax=Clonorchis sinensis TaxID=79923 RepID=G7YSK2_CLOSI|nr:hypothetical protein CSKR_114074 [Clonorchis sinensis]GAA55932.1 hypothetical protein CLF_109402 [Clonorchis sinensis]